MDIHSGGNGLNQELVRSVLNGIREIRHRFFPDIMQEFDELAQRRDPKDFYNAARERGYYDEEDLRGTPLMAYSGIFSEGKRLDFIDCRDKYSKLARIALRRFGELERGERISIEEIRTKMRNLRENGYSAGKYYEMDKEELWSYWKKVKQDIRRFADIFCPRVLVEIDDANRSQVRDARNHL